MNDHQNQDAGTAPCATEPQRLAALFPLGRIVATPAVVTHLEESGIHALEPLSRHVRGDWGEIPPEDALENRIAIRHGFRVLSAYTVAGKRIWIITEADRSVTTLLFPHEY